MHSTEPVLRPSSLTRTNVPKQKSSSKAGRFSRKPSGKQQKSRSNANKKKKMKRHMENHPNDLQTKKVLAEYKGKV